MKIFDATSSEYSPDTATSAPARPLFPTPESDELGQQASGKRQREATDTVTGKRTKRRSSLKGRKSVSSADGSFKRSVHFENNHENQHALPKESPKESEVTPTPKESEALSNKRPLDEQTEPQAEEQGPSTKLSKHSTEDDSFPFKYSVYKAVNRPMPKLPILEKLEAKLARVKELCEPKPPTPEQLEAIEEARRKRARQVDEDELALNRARILAETLRRGPGLFDGFKGFKPAIWERPPWNDPNYNPADKYRARLAAMPPRSTYFPPRLTLHKTFSGYEVHLADDTPEDDTPEQPPVPRGPRRIRRPITHDPRDLRDRYHLHHVSADTEVHRQGREDRAKALRALRAKADAKEKKGDEDGGKNPKGVNKGGYKKNEGGEQGASS
jgi:hypothetical protein